MGYPFPLTASLLEGFVRKPSGRLLPAGWISSTRSQPCKNYLFHRVTGSKHWAETGKISTASVLTANTAFAFSGQSKVQTTSRSRTIIKENKMIRIPTNRTPTHPGEMLLEEFLTPMSLTQHELADAIHVPYQRINDLVNGRRGVTPSSALRLAKFFGNPPDFWMNLQLSWDLYFEQQSENKVIETIHPYKHHTSTAT
jgi:addiction module HigA family antidote